MSDTKQYRCRRCSYPKLDGELDKMGYCQKCNDYLATQTKTVAARIRKFVTNAEQEEPEHFLITKLPGGIIRGIYKDHEGGETMTDNKKGARLGYDPLAGKDTPKGIDGLIRATAPEAQTTQTTQTERKIPGKKGERGEPLPRINMAFAPEQLEYLRTMAGLENISITRYIYNLVGQDMANRNELYGKLAELKGANK